MLFNTGHYGLFFVAVLVLHWLLPVRLRRAFLLVASYYFYASAIPRYLVLILAMTIFSYGIGLWLGRARGRTRRVLLWVGIAGNLGSLAYFKYSHLLLLSAEQLAAHLPLLGPLVGDDPIVVNVLLPLGISFFTFEFIHYVAEVYKGLKPMRNPIDFALFAAFFPTQIAGPIKRFPDFAKQLQHPLRLREVNFDAGIGLILRGLLKKTVLADVLAPVVAQTFHTPGTLGAGTAWFAVLAFAAQIYGDFSGYTDIGRGCAQLLGYSVPENFARPYQSANPAEFWHRWHMSLSTWLRDYLYIPLGGSRVSPPRVYINLMITMALGGLWHGAQWHYMVWGIYQGVLLCAHRLWARSVGKMAWYRRLLHVPVLNFLTRPFTLIFVCVGWIFFRADSLGAAFQMLASLVSFARPLGAGFTWSLTSMPVLLMAGAAVVVVGGWLWSVGRESILRVWRAGSGWLSAGQLAGVRAVVVRPMFYAAALLILVLWPPHEVVRFIYFQF
jgi:D-alanyl-lipoteichoic acid acyltransferase DltB (MBOAT superfamily)